jgi:predicted MFS family arabinose efflux permease
MAEATHRATYRGLFAIAEFRVLWLAQVTSVAGDQLARVALTVLVYDRTHSALLAALTYVASIVPLFVGGVLLSGIADRLPRRAVMISCDLARAVLVAVMVIPGMPLAALIVLLALVTLLGAPFQSARTAMLPDILPGDGFALGQAVSMTTYQLAQVAGFAVGGVVAGLLGTRTSLLADAVSFAISGLLVWRRVQARQAPRPATEPPNRMLTDLGTAIRLVFGRRELRTPMLLGWLSAFYNVPDGVAAPLARALHGGAVTVGIILTAQAFGATTGRVAFTRWVVPSRQRALMGPLAILASAVLMLLAARPGLTGSLLVLAASGVLACFQAPASAAFVTAAPPQRRGQAFGLAIAGMNLSQGAALLVAGAVAGRIAPAVVIAAAGAAGTAAAITIVLTDRSRR